MKFPFTKNNHHFPSHLHFCMSSYSTAMPAEYIRECKWWVNDPIMNRYTHSASTKFYYERSTQTRESQDNSETEESDFGPCLIGNAPPIMSHPRYSSFSLSGSNKQYTTKTHRRRIKWRVGGTSTTVSSTTEHRAWADKYCQYGWCNCNRIAYKGISIYFIRIAMLMENVTVRATAIFLFEKSLY